MTTERPHDPILWSTIAVVVLVAATAVAGLYWPATYARETPLARAAGYGSDVVDLFLVVPVLLISGIGAHRGSVPARLVWLGAQGYLLYNFVIYAFGVHFNSLFLVYCSTLGICLYATVFSLPSLRLDRVAQTYGPRAPRRTIAIVLLVLAVSIAMFDLRDDMAAVVAGTVPPAVIAANQPVNFAHVLDLVFLVPAMAITATLLLRRRASSFALAPVLLTLLVIMNFELASIMVELGRWGLGLSVSMIVFFAALGVGLTVLLGVYLSLGTRAVVARDASATGGDMPPTETSAEDAEVHGE